MVAAVAETIVGLAVILSVAVLGHYDGSTFFSIDAMGAIVLLTIIIVNLAASFYSVGYLRKELDKGIVNLGLIKKYYVLLPLFVAAMVIAVCSTNPIVMWIAIEATTLSTVFLVGFYNKPASMEAAWKYLIISSIGLLLGLFGTLLFFTASSGGSIATWHSLLLNASLLNPLVVKIAFILAFVGYGTKVGLAPMHTWLPDAHSKAPAPVSALLSGALLNVALLSILRLKLISDAAIGAGFSQGLLIFFGTLSIIIAAFIILGQKSYKRLMAYSSIEHMGIAALGFGFGGVGVFFAFLHMIYHSITKSLLFFVSGNVFLKYSSTKIAKIKGVFSSLPVTGVMLVIAFLAITGVPPFGIFITEFSILSAGIGGHPAYTIIVLFCLALVFVGFFRHIVHIIFGHPHEQEARGENGVWTLIPPIFLGLLLVVLSIYLPESLKSILNSAASIIK